MSARILVVDDHVVVREGVRTIIGKARPRWEICGEAANGQEAIDAATRLKPDVIILDITMPGMSGLEAASQISQRGITSRILMFTMHESGELATDARQVGASGFVTKADAARHLVLAIETLLSGGTFFGNPEKGPEPRTKPSLGMILLRMGLAYS